MHTVVILVVISSLTAVSIAQRDECKKLEHPHSVHCCKQYNQQLKDKKTDDVKECFDNSKKPPPSCDTEICIAKKRGYLASEEGTADKSLFEAFVVNMFEDYPDLVEAIKKECINGDLIKYGPPGACELIKMKICVLRQMTMNCQDWEEKGQCKELKELADKCKEE